MGDSKDDESYDVDDLWGGSAWGDDDDDDDLKSEEGQEQQNGGESKKLSTINDNFVDRYATKSNTS
eukprot:5849415-Ditylum_brightwellii.AAC.1